jgi:spore germination protein KA
LTPLIPRKWTDLFDSVIRMPTLFLKYKPGITRAQTKKKPPVDKEA